MLPNLSNRDGIAMYTALNLRTHMDVLTSCGTLLGTVERVEDNRFKLAEIGPKSGPRAYWVPLEWVDTVNLYVHLNKTLQEAIRLERAAEESRVVHARRWADANERKVPAEKAPACF
jgi:hypothetical protein